MEEIKSHKPWTKIDTCIHCGKSNVPVVYCTSPLHEGDWCWGQICKICVDTYLDEAYEPIKKEKRKKARKNLIEYMDSEEHIQDLETKEKEYKDKLANNPDNGKKGWWAVCGIRHNAVVKASSAAEAVEKADKANAVGEWESATARFLSEWLPDVVRL